MLGCYKPEKDKASSANLGQAVDILHEETGSAYECFLLCQENSECENFAWLSPEFNVGKYTVDMTV